MKRPLRIVVVGGGLGGLGAAIHLALAGHRVTLLERSPAFGGKASRYEQDGWSFDTGPSLLTMPEVLDELFEAAGRSRAEVLPLRRLDPQCRYFFPDGTSLDLRDDHDETLDAVRAFAGPEETARFARTLDLSRRIFETVGRPFLDKPFEGIGQLAATYSANPLTALRLGTGQGSLAAFAARQTSHESLRWLIERYATYAGGAPALTPATYAMVLHVETSGGAWYPIGGIGRIVEALVGLAREVGVELRAGAPVDEIVVAHGRVVGVRSRSDTEGCDAVVSNADPVTVARKLLPEAEARRTGLDQHLKQQLSLSGAVLLLGLRCRTPQLAHHNVVFPRGYPEEFVDLFQRSRAPVNPAVYLCVPSRTDPSRAPAGGESLFCMTNAPPLQEGSSFADQREASIERIKMVVAELVPDIAGRIAVQRYIGPDELRARFDAPGGSIYGVAPHGWLSPFHRPLQRVRRLRGLYFAGGGTHPGGGIPLVLRSGRFAADLLARDWANGRVTSAPEGRAHVAS